MREKSKVYFNNKKGKYLAGLDFGIAGKKIKLILTQLIDRYAHKTSFQYF